MQIIIVICSLLLLAYIFDISSSKTKIPTVIILLLLGWFVKQIFKNLNIEIVDLSSLLPILGTIGLILIVLEGSLELEITKNKLKFIGKSALMALIPIILISISFGSIIYHFDDISFKDALSNAVPFAIISSAIAIPSVKGFDRNKKEFIIYESSFSDIIGVVLFNFLVFNEVINLSSFGYFFLDILFILFITILSTLSLAFFISFVRLHVKFVPIIIFVILLYSITKIFHLPGLILIMIFGLFLGNMKNLTSYKYINLLNPEELIKESKRFKEITQEMAFLVRALFFLLFGFLINSSDVYDLKSLVWSLLILSIIIVTRYLTMIILKIKIDNLVYIAPRGLITILLVLSLPNSVRTEFLGDSVIIQVIILSSLFMMIGTLKDKNLKIENTEHLETENDIPTLSDKNLIEDTNNDL